MLTRWRNEQGLLGIYICIYTYQCLQCVSNALRWPWAIIINITIIGHSASLLRLICVEAPMGSPLAKDVIESGFRHTEVPLVYRD